MPQDKEANDVPTDQQTTQHGLTSAPSNRAPVAIPALEGGCPTAAAITRSLNSSDLFGRARTVLINHGGEQYRLTVTKNGKLILQK